MGFLEIQKVSEALKALELGEGDRFVGVMELFVTDKRPQVDNLQADAERTEKDLKSLLKLFGEEDGTTSEEFFTVINKFSLNLKKAHIENEQAKEIQKPKAPLPKPKPAGLATGLGMSMGLGAGDLDNAISQLKRGKSFKGKREERRNNILSGEEKVAPEALLRLQNLRKAN